MSLTAVRVPEWVHEKAITVLRQYRQGGGKSLSHSLWKYQFKSHASLAFIIP